MSEKEKSTIQEDQGSNTADKLIEKLGQGEQDVQPELIEVGEHQLGKAEAETLKSLGYDLEKDLSGASEDDIIDILSNNISKDNEKPSSKEPSVPLITEEMVKGGFAKSLVGQPVTELIKSIENQDKEIAKLRSQLNQKKEEKINEDDSNFLNDDFDFAELTPKQQKEYMLKLLSEAEEKGSKKAIEQFKNEFGHLLEPLQQQRVKEEQKEFFNSIQSKLPEGMKVEQVLNDWKNEFGNNLTQSEADFYANNPNRFILEISNYAKMKHLEKLATMTEQEKLKFAKKVSAENLKKAVTNQAKSTTNKHFNDVPREVESTGSKTLDKIYQRVVLSK